MRLRARATTTARSRATACRGLSHVHKPAPPPCSRGRRPVGEALQSFATAPLEERAVRPRRDISPAPRYVRLIARRSARTGDDAVARAGGDMDEKLEMLFIRSGGGGGAHRAARGRDPRDEVWRLRDKARAWPSQPWISRGARREGRARDRTMTRRSATEVPQARMNSRRASSNGPEAYLHVGLDVRAAQDSPGCARARDREPESQRLVRDSISRSRAARKREALAPRRSAGGRGS